MNAVEQGRQEIGLTRAQALRLIDARPTQLALFSHEDAQLDPVYVQRMAAAVDAYRGWVSQMLEWLHRRDTTGGGPLSMWELSTLTGVREVNLTQLRTRGTLTGLLCGNEYVYTTDAVRDFIRSNATALRDGRRKARGHLASAFLRYYAVPAGQPLATPPADRDRQPEAVA